MKFCRINLSKTNYSIDLLDWKFLLPSSSNISACNQLYREYCLHKKFSSVMPIFDSQYQDVNTDILGYYTNNNLVAFSLVKRWDSDNAESLQFAWNYEEPSLYYGIKSLMVECAIYKARGFKYLYLGQAAEYKSQIAGYEILGPI